MNKNSFKKQIDWVKNYSSDDIEFIMLMSMTYGKGYWPDEINDNDNLVFAQIISNNNSGLLKHSVAKDGTRKATSVTNYIAFRFRALTQDIIDEWIKHNNLINYTYHQRDMVTFRFEIPKDLLSNLQ